MNNNEKSRKKTSPPLKELEKNNHFFGKLMTVEDAKAEQDYFNEKRRLLNRLKTKKKFNLEDWLNENEELFEVINSNLNIQGDVVVGDERNRALLVATLAHLPEDVREKTLEKATFIMASEGVIGTFFDLVVREPQTIHCILLNFCSMKRLGDSRKMDTIAHEIAHYWLGHGS